MYGKSPEYYELDNSCQLSSPVLRKILARLPLKIWIFVHLNSLCYFPNMNCFLILLMFLKSVFFCFTFKWYQRKQKCLWLWQLQLLHLINTPLHVLLISILIAPFTHVCLFYSCYGSIAKISKTKHWYNESDTHTLRLTNTHTWKRCLNLQQASNVFVFDSFIFFFIVQKYFVNNSAITFNILKFLQSRIHSSYHAKHTF